MLGKRAAEALFEPATTTRESAAGRSRRATGQQATTARLSDDPARAKEIRKEQKEALVAGVACHLEGSAWNSCGLSKKALMPTIQNIRRACRGSVKCGWRKLTKRQRQAIYRDWSDKTIMEACDGTMPAIELGDSATGTRGQRGLLQLKAASELFRTEVLTSALAAGTRKRYFPLWKGFVTFGIAHGALTQVMPATREIVQAWALELMMLGASPSLIRSSVAAVQSRHTDFGFAPPLSGKLEFKRMMKAVGSLQGTPRRQIMPLSRRMLRRLMRLKGLTPAQNRNVLVTVLGTQLCCRVGELKRMQICDFLPGFDATFHPKYHGSAAFRIRKRKQDQLRRGLYPRVLPGSRSDLCTVQRLKAMLQAKGVRVAPDCTKGAHPAARCRHCPALFVSERRVDGVRQHMSRQQISGAVKSSLKLIGIDSPLVSGISMRRGGISAAVHARVPEPVLFLQSGHGSGMAARAYMVPQDPRVQLETARALRL
jgi:hypothetical protein